MLEPPAAVEGSVVRTPRTVSMLTLYNQNHCLSCLKLCFLLQGKDVVYRYATAGYRDCAKVYHTTRLGQSPSGFAELAGLPGHTSLWGTRSLALQDVSIRPWQPLRTIFGTKE